MALDEETPTDLLWALALRRRVYRIIVEELDNEIAKAIDEALEAKLSYSQIADALGDEKTTVFKWHKRRRRNAT